MLNTFNSLPWLPIKTMAIEQHASNMTNQPADLASTRYHVLLYGT
jgi:hypothetical protein